MTGRPQRFSDADATIDWLIDTVGHEICVGAPLGLGKAPQLMNALYRRARADRTIRLTIITALSLDVPEAGSPLERRLMEPIVERVFEDYPGLDYLRDVRRQAVPDNITISEFFFQPGAMLGNTYAQRHYRSVNYTHAGRDLLDAGVNVLMQMVAPGLTDDQISLSCNTDVTLDLMPRVEAMRARGNAPLVIGQINQRLPTMTRSALVPATMADALFAGPAADFKPFGAPAAPVSDADYAIALRVSALLADGGTLQIGIGSLSDAIAYCCDLRHNDNAAFRTLLERLQPSAADNALIERYAGRAPFERGLYGCTEMLVDAYIHLYRAGVISRRVYDDAAIQRLLDAGEIDETVGPHTLSALHGTGALRARLNADDLAYLQRLGVFHADVRCADAHLDPGDGGPLIAANLDDSDARRAIEARCLGTRLAGPTLVHGAFYLGPNDFYQRLRELSGAERDLFHMSSVHEINHLYGDEHRKRAQRRYARFINTAIKVSLDGAVAADGLDNGQVLSGVGGQYNFVSQAHELEDARSIICVRATRAGSDGPESNIVADYAYNTIPRHLRDLVITEYGVADLRGQTDENIAIALIEIADARFQDDLRARAVAAGKLSAEYSVPERARRNRPDWVREVLAPERANERFPVYPYGSDFSAIEQTLMAALKRLAGASKRTLLRDAARHARAWTTLPAAAMPYLQRMALAEPRGWQQHLHARVVVLALARAGKLDSEVDG